MRRAAQTPMNSTHPNPLSVRRGEGEATARALGFLKNSGPCQDASGPQSKLRPGAKARQRCHSTAERAHPDAAAGARTFLSAATSGRLPVPAACLFAPNAAADRNVRAPGLIKMRPHRKPAVAEYRENVRLRQSQQQQWQLRTPTWQQSPQASSQQHER